MCEKLLKLLECTMAMVLGTWVRRCPLRVHGPRDNSCMFLVCTITLTLTVPLTLTLALALILTLTLTLPLALALIHTLTLESVERMSLVYRWKVCKRVGKGGWCPRSCTSRPP